MVEIDESIKTNCLATHFGDDVKQVLTILPNKDLKIIITIPHEIFEWFIDVYEREDSPSYTNWIDHYGATETELRAEMKGSIEEFILTICKHPVRLSNYGGPNHKMLQLCKNEIWIDVTY